jgi:hypothetical protein
MTAVGSAIKKAASEASLKNSPGLNKTQPDSDDHGAKSDDWAAEYLAEKDPGDNADDSAPSSDFYEPRLSKDIATDAPAQATEAIIEEPPVSKEDEMLIAIKQAIKTENRA